MENRYIRRFFRRQALLATSAILWTVTSGCYWLQPDWLAPVTLVPTWLWLVPAMVLTGYGFGRMHTRWFVVVVGLWAVYAAVLVEESWSLVRIGSGRSSEWKAACDDGRAVRVVSLNCGTNPLAATEVLKWQPDLVLLQESPSREHVERLARQMFGREGSYLWSSDTSIVACGHVRPRGVERVSHFVHAEVEFPAGIKAEVMSVRLHPPVFRLDFWMPGFWGDHRANRVKHRRQILEIVERIGSIDASTPLIVGGDFNAPPGDGAIVPLGERLHDTFREAGRGWGNTGTNDLPLFRVDQVWASDHFRAECVTAQKTLHSDHRLVVCDLIYAPSVDLLPK